MNLLQIVWDVSPVIFNLGSLSIRWYGVLFASAFIISYLILKKVFQKENEWFSIDLGSTQKFNQIKINWEYWPAAYDIKISNDGKDWTKIADRSLAIKEKPEPQPIDVLNLGKTIEARYMRIDMTKRPDKSGAKAGCSQWTPDAYSIWELGIYLR